MGKYVPEPTPVIEEPPDGGVENVEHRAIRELQRYINQELGRISDSVNVKVDGAYGGLFQIGPSIIITPLTAAPVLFDAYTDVIPERPDGIVASAALGSLGILTPGSFILQFTTTIINILPNAEYAFLLALNGASTGLGGVVEPSNQTEQHTVAFNILFDATKGDIFTMLINSVSNNDAEVINSEFIASRVSEEFG